MKRILVLVAAGLCLLSLLGCTSTGPQAPGNAFSNPSAPQGPEAQAAQGVTITNEMRAALLRPADSLFTLGPGDRIEIEVIGHPTTRATMVVGPDGKIYYNLLSGLNVWGLTLAQTRDLLQNQLAKYMAEPQVSITLREVGSKYVWLLGRLARPGIYPMTGTMTLLESLALAGGTMRSSSTVSTEELADLRHSFVMRRGQLLPADFYRLLREGDMSQNIFLQPDDFVYVPSALAQEVYIFGAVRTPRVAPYIEHMTLVSAISGSAGTVTYDLLASQDFGPFTPDAYLSHVAIVRGSLTEPKVIVVDYKAVIKGQARDVLLEAGDIIYIPNSPYTNLKRYANLILNTFIGTIAANQGIQAGGGTVGTTAVGVSVPVGSTTGSTTSAH
jgi:protein involved in polysaccharide export with SLBB domain